MSPSTDFSCLYIKVTESIHLSEALMDNASSETQNLPRQFHIFGGFKGTVLATSLVMLLGAGTAGCPLSDLVFSLWIGPYVEFEQRCTSYGSADAHEAAIDYCLLQQFNGGSFTACYFDCIIPPPSVAMGKSAAAGEELFWIDNERRLVHTAPGASSTTVVVNYGHIPAGIAVDESGGHLYWADMRGNRIRQSALDGSSVVDLPIAASGPISVAYQSATNSIFWTTGTAGTIRKSNTDGSALADVVTGLDGPGDIAIDEAGGKLYWIDLSATGSALQRSNIDGSSIETLVNSTSVLLNLTLDIVGAKVYWSNSTSGELRRSNLDGSTNELVISGIIKPGAIAIDAANAKIVWYEIDGLAIKRANLDGTSTQTLQSFSPATDLAVAPTSGKIYYTGFVRGTVTQMNLDGSSRSEIYTPPTIFSEVAVDEGRSKVYWITNAGDLLRSNYDGSGTETLVTSIVASRTLDFDLINDKLYWVSNGDIFEADPDGSNPVVIVSGAIFANEISIDGVAGKVYWIENQNIRRANLDGSGNQLFYFESGYARQLAAINGNIYWTVGSVVKRADGSGPINVTDVVTGLAGPYHLDVTDTNIYWNLLGTPNTMQRSGLDGTGITDVATGDRVSGFAVAASGALPVELATFTGIADDSVVELFWQTQSERNVSGFEVQQKASVDTDWMDTGFERASESGLDKGASYRFRIENIEPDTYEFRLKIIDNDGSFEYSEVVNVFIPASSPISLSAAFPNPFNSGTTFSITSQRDAETTIDVFDLLGRKVKTLYQGQLSANRLEHVRLSGEGLSPGTYVVYLKSGRLSKTMTVVLAE